MSIKEISKYLAIVPAGCTSSSCSPCQFVELIDNLIRQALFYLILPVCVVAFIGAGILWLSSVGNPQKIEKGKNIFFYALWGLILAFAAYLIIHIILVMLVDPNFLDFENGLTFPTCPVS